MIIIITNNTITMLFNHDQPKYEKKIMKASSSVIMIIIFLK